MPEIARSILEELASVDLERKRRLDDPGLDFRVRAVKAFQQQRFRATYADFLDIPRYAGAARFFLDELYGPIDFSQRDAQFARIVPTLVRLFPSQVVTVVMTLARLHALSEQLDSVMAGHLNDASAIEDVDYARAWIATGRAADRGRQVDLMVQTATSLDQLTHRPLLRNSLRMMRRPARAAGLGALQSFLEDGFEAFRSMRGAQDFIMSIASRETALISSLFRGDVDALRRPVIRMDSVT